MEFEGIGSEWRDANVLVKREKVKNLSTKQLVGGHQKSSFTYEITVRNKKAQTIVILIEDQIPVPNTKEIDVEKIEDSKAEYKEETGLLKWKKQIASGKAETIKLQPRLCISEFQSPCKSVKMNALYQVLFQTFLMLCIRT